MPAFAGMTGIDSREVETALVYPRMKSLGSMMVLRPLRESRRACRRRRSDDDILDRLLLLAG